MPQHPSISDLWYCYQCGDGPYSDGYVDVCVKCGTAKSEHARIEAEPYYESLGDLKNNDLEFYAQLPPEYYVGNDADSWFSPGFGHHTWTEPLVQVGLVLVASTAALDVGGHYGAWSSMPWAPLNCHESLPSRPSSVSDGALCGGHTVASTVVFGVAATAFHHLNYQHGCQDAHLFTGITLGIGIGLCLGSDLENTMFNILPWTILASLLCSTLVHKIWTCNANYTSMEA